MPAEEIPHIFTQEAGDVVNLTKWMFASIQPFIKGRTLELGSRRGMISSIFVDHKLPIHLSDELEENRQILNERFRDIPEVRMIHDIDFFSREFESIYSSSFGAFSTAVAINIVEHGYYDELALNNAKYLLRIRGHLIIITPTYIASFNGIREDLEEMKMQNAKVVKKIMGDNIEVLKVRFFNWQLVTDYPTVTRDELSILTILRKTY